MANHDNNHNNKISIIFNAYILNISLLPSFLVIYIELTNNNNNRYENFDLPWFYEIFGIEINDALLYI